MDDNRITEQSANDLYAHYIAERPLSHGLFGNIDVSDINQVANQLADLTAQVSCEHRQNRRYQAAFAGKRKQKHQRYMRHQWIVCICGGVALQ